MNKTWVFRCVCWIACKYQTCIFLMKIYNLGRVTSDRSEVHDIAQRFFSGFDMLDLHYGSFLP